MDELFRMLERGETPNFAEMMEALNFISDIDWQALEAPCLSITDVLTRGSIPKHPLLANGSPCELCG